MHIENNAGLRRAPEENGYLTSGEMKYLIALALAGTNGGRVPDRYREEFGHLEAVAPSWLTGMGHQVAVLAREMHERTNIHLDGSYIYSRLPMGCRIKYTGETISPEAAVLLLRERFPYADDIAEFPNKGFTQVRGPVDQALVVYLHDGEWKLFCFQPGDYEAVKQGRVE